MASGGLAPPRRVLILGVTGSGKSVLACEVAGRLGLRVVDGDAVLWLPGWGKRSEDEQMAVLNAATAEDGWVLDGARSAWMPGLLAQVDLVVGLDYSWWRSFARLLRRTVYRLVTRERFAGGNTERLRETLSRDSILVWHFQSFARQRERIRILAKDPGPPRVIRLTSPRATRIWLSQLYELR